MLKGKASMGARSGDRVRAANSFTFESSREGVLHLKNTEFDGVLVLVDYGGEDELVNARSVEVIEPAVRPADNFDNEDRKDFDGWSPVHDLDQAIAKGLVCWMCLRDPEFEEETVARARTDIRPFLDAGWQLIDVYRWRDYLEIDRFLSVSMSLQRNEVDLEVICDECGSGGEFGLNQLYGEENVDADGLLDEPMFAYRTEEELRAELADRGLLNWITRSRSPD
jgi:hypothetical protein